ncbi:MAG: hypothetical protein AB8G22_25650 [Saprospiraceae bacterium]
MRHHIISIAKYIFLLGILLVSHAALAQQAAEPKEAAASPIREEIQRYAGYEDLLPRYLSLPYDVTMNTNIQSTYVDISFLLLLFLPLLFLLGNSKRPWMNIVVILGMLLMVTIAIPTGYSNRRNVPVEQVGEHLQNYLNETSFSDAPTRVITSYIYQFFNTLYQPLASLFDSITGQSDYITYPLLIALFLGILQLINFRVEDHSLVTKSIVNLLSFFALLWLVLSAGIPWYGLLMITLGLMFIVAGFVSKNVGFLANYRLKYYGFLSILAVWIFMSFAYRASNYLPTNEANAKNLLFPVVLQYAGNVATDGAVLDAVFPQFKIAMEQINREEKSLILRIGTFLPFFVKKNDKRIVTDNQLGFFDGLDKAFPNKTEMAQAMKASGFRYIIIDLNTAKIDQTPEQTLRKKFTRLVQFVDRNPALQFVATDNVVRTADGNNIYSVSGANVVRPGNFAVFEIIDPIVNLATPK